MTPDARQLEAAQAEIARLQSQTAKQRNEIHRLTRQVAQLQADKTNMLFDLKKLRGEIA